jgi:hypothetical protein
MSTRDRRVYVHVGVPKSGTTFLQGTLANRRKQLRAAGVLYPQVGPESMFRAAVDVRRAHKSWGRDRSDVKGVWDQLCRKARQYDGHTVLSHELLAGATGRQAAGALSMLKGLDVHVVVTARDLVHQATAEWQESLKHGRRVTFEEFRERIMAPEREHDHAERFWASQDVPDVLARWGATLPREHVHVVVCPPPGSDPAVLWRRFAGAVGFDPRPFEDDLGSSTNSSLGVVEIDLLRRVNLALDGRLAQPAYGRVVKQYFTKQLLVQHRSARPEVPPDMYDELVELATDWVKQLDRAGYAVHGDLNELVPDRPAPSGRHPDDVDPAAVVDTSASVIADLLVELAQLRP